LYQPFFARNNKRIKVFQKELKNSYHLFVQILRTLNHGPDFDWMNLIKEIKRSSHLITITKSNLQQQIGVADKIN
jgi:(p)ppGpp synthase/HD superfamily hydrolase